jgi:hypothetical protein
MEVDLNWAAESKTAAESNSEEPRKTAAESKRAEAKTTAEASLKEALTS